MLSAHKDLARRLDALEKKYAEHSEQFVAVFQASSCRLTRLPHVE
jgi:hypothetical protein